jgi:hypothetical protein
LAHPKAKILLSLLHSKYFQEKDKTMVFVCLYFLNQFMLMEFQDRTAIALSGAEGEGFSVSSKLEKDLVDWNENTKLVVSVRAKGKVKCGPGSINLGEIRGWSQDLKLMPEAAEFLWDENEKLWKAEFNILPQKAGFILIPEIPFSFRNTLVSYPEKSHMLVFSESILLQVKEPQMIESFDSRLKTMGNVPSQIVETALALVLAPLSMFLAWKMIRKYLSDNLDYQKPGKGGWIIKLLISNPMGELTRLDWMSNLQSYFRNTLMPGHGVLTAREISGGVFRKYLGEQEQETLADFFQNLENGCFGVEQDFDESLFRTQALVWVRLFESRR